MATMQRWKTTHAVLVIYIDTDSLDPYLALNDYAVFAGVPVEVLEARLEALGDDLGLKFVEEGSEVLTLVPEAVFYHWFVLDGKMSDVIEL